MRTRKWGLCWASWEHLAWHIPIAFPCLYRILKEWPFWATESMTFFLSYFSLTLSEELILRSIALRKTRQNLRSWFDSPFCGRLSSICALVVAIRTYFLWQSFSLSRDLLHLILLLRGSMALPSDCSLWRFLDVQDDYEVDAQTLY